MVLTVKLARQSKSMSQEQMSNVLGITLYTYRKKEKHPETFTMAEAKKILEVTGFCYEEVSFSS